MLELKIISPQEEGFIQEIKWNKEEVIAAVDTMMANYRGLVYTEESIKEAKTDRANLNKLLDAFETERKRLKKLCEVPYKKFETDIKQVANLIQEPIKMIDTQIKEVEEAKRVEKKSKILEYYDAHVESLRGLLPFEKVFKQEYLNATKSMKMIKTEIDELFVKVNSDMNTIEGLKTKYEFQVKDVYLRTLDLALALRENARLEEVAAKLEKQRQAEELTRKQEEENQAEMTIPEINSAEETYQTKSSSELPVNKYYVVGLQIYGTRNELMAFQNFLTKNKIHYEVTTKAKEAE